MFFLGSCGAHLYASSYPSFHSPGYPGCYPNNVLCTWLIEAPPGYYVQLHIYDFNLEYGGNNCPWDFLEIHDGSTVSSPLLIKACGYLSSFALYSSGRFLFLRFYSDGVIPMSGFSAWCGITSYRECNTFFSFRFGFLSFLSKVFVIIILLLLLSIQLFNHYHYDCIVIIIIITGHSITIAMVIVIVLLFDRMLFLSHCF